MMTNKVQVYEEFDQLNKGKGKCQCKIRCPYRLYIREGGKGKQKFVPWGVTCIRCGFVSSKNPIRLSKERIEHLEWVQEYYEKLNAEHELEIAKST